MSFHVSTDAAADPLVDASEEADVASAKNAATYIVDLLNAIGVQYVFGVPGGAIEPLYNALAVSERSGGTRAVVARHEAGAAFMAEGVARQTGKLGVCCTTSGPGATNLITGVACAFENDIPMLAITSQPAVPLLGRRAIQESSCTGVDVVGMFTHCTRFNSLVSHADQVEGKTTAAILRALQVPYGPAHLSFPVDVLRSPIPYSVDPRSFANLAASRTFYDPNAVEDLRQALRDSHHPVFVLGRGCAGSMQGILRLVEFLGTPFVVTPDAKGLVNTHHPLYRGVFGFAGHESARSALSPSADLIVLVGSRISEFTSAAWDAMLLGPRLVHVDESPEHCLHSPMARMHVLGSLPEVFSRLLDWARQDPHAVPFHPAREESSITAAASTPFDADSHEPSLVKPQRLMGELSERMPAGARFVADIGNSMTWAINCLESPQHEGNADVPQAPWLHVLTEYAPMGWAIGTAVGLARADSSTAVVCITGDGSYLMSGQEITVAAQERLPVIFVVLNDGALGMVKHGQMLVGAERTAVDLPEVDYRRLAEALGVPAYVVSDLEDLDDLNLDVIAARRGPTLLDVRIDGAEVPPMHLRVKALN